jgi:regulation of enolase protein 1 (concanavalin A-like superfamily)
VASASVAWPSAVYVGLATSSGDTRRLATASFSTVQVSALADGNVPAPETAAGTSGGITALAVVAAGLPAEWEATDIGAPAVSGSVSYANSTFTIDGAGRDIWDASDQFTYGYRRVSGNVDIIARVNAIENVDEWAKAGVMIRSSLNATSTHVSLFVTAGSGVAFQRRTTTGGSSAHTAVAPNAAPVWLRLTRSGNTITARGSTNGTDWVTVGTQTLTLPTSFYVGLAVTSHVPSRAATATFRNVTVSGASASGVAPAVSLTSPQNGASIAPDTTVNITATASDSDGSVAKVDFYQGSTLIGSDSTSPYTAAWSNPPSGTHVLTAVATDNSGMTTRSAERQIVVSAGTNPAPAVSLTLPSGNGPYTAPASIQFSATASDADGIARVEFYANGSATPLRTDTTSPYTYTWTNVPAGTYVLKAVAYDNRNASRSSNEITVTVGSVAPAPTRRLAFTPSTSHATVQSYRLEIFSQGANPATGTVRATLNLGKPTVTNNEIIVTVTDTIAPLAAGNYFATVTAISSGGSTRSAASPVFTR